MRRLSILLEMKVAAMFKKYAIALHQKLMWH